MKKIIYLIVLTIFAPYLVNASSCSSAEKAELISKAGVININYERVTIEYETTSGYPEYLPEEEYDDYVFTVDIMEINILNLISDFYIEISNDVNDDIILVEYDDLENGIYTFIQSDTNNVYSYKFAVYASEETKCESEIQTYKYLVIPKYNKYHNLAVCEGYEEQSVCQEYTTISDLTQSYVYSKIANLKNDVIDNENIETDYDEFEDILNYVMEYYIQIIGIVVIVFILVTGGIIVAKKRRVLK